MDSFAVVVHPLHPKLDVARRYPFLGRVLPTPLILFLTRRWPPLILSRIQGLRSQWSEASATGWLVACPLTASQLMRLPPQAVYDKLVQSGRLAQHRGARILGLGGIASAVGDSGVTVAQRLAMPVTTGKSLTVGLAIEGLKAAAEERGLSLEGATAAVVGASGSIGLACAEMLAPLAERLILVGRQEIRLSEARAWVEAAGAANVEVATGFGTVSQADVVVTATTSLQPILHGRSLKKGALVCDVALPPDLDPAVSEERGDVTVVRGGIARLPGGCELGFDLGLPAGHVYGCLAEVMVLALEGRYESYSLGRRVHIDKVREITQLAWRHGFSLPGGARLAPSEEGQ